MVQIHPMKIEGNWIAGVALDFHTTSSTYIGDDEFGHARFDTVRPEVAELLYRLKYGNHDQAAVAGIVEAASGFLKPFPDKFDVIVPALPSTARAVQPVYLLANGIGKATGKPVAHCVTATRATSQLKAVSDPDERKRLLEGLYAVDPTQVAGLNVLLFDDLFRSGSTMNAIADALLKQGKAASVRALTITKTRSNR
jgi:predicted amidophosphoribosyltransferase